MLRSNILLCKLFCALLFVAAVQGQADTSLQYLQIKALRMFPGREDDGIRSQFLQSQGVSPSDSTYASCRTGSVSVLRAEMVTNWDERWLAYKRMWLSDSWRRLSWQEDRIYRDASELDIQPEEIWPGLSTNMLEATSTLRTEVSAALLANATNSTSLVLQALLVPHRLTDLAYLASAVRGSSLSNSVKGAIWEQIAQDRLPGARSYLLGMATNPVTPLLLGKALVQDLVQSEGDLRGVIEASEAEGITRTLLDVDESVHLGFSVPSDLVLGDALSSSSRLSLAAFSLEHTADPRLVRNIVRLPAGQGTELKGALLGLERGAISGTCLSTEDVIGVATNVHETPSNRLLAVRWLREEVDAMVTHTVASGLSDFREDIIRKALAMIENDDTLGSDLRAAASVDAAGTVTGALRTELASLFDSDEYRSATNFLADPAAAGATNPVALVYYTSLYTDTVNDFREQAAVLGLRINAGAVLNFASLHNGLLPNSLADVPDPVTFEGLDYLYYPVSTVSQLVHGVVLLVTPKAIASAFTNGTTRLPAIMGGGERMEVLTPGNYGNILSANNEYRSRTANPIVPTNVISSLLLFHGQ